MAATVARIPSQGEMAEIMSHFRAWSDGRSWRVRNMWTGEVLEGAFADEGAARTGAHNAASRAIRDILIGAKP